MNTLLPERTPSLDPLAALKARLDPARLPAHVAIIMDGNGRWARAQGQDRLFGHWQGYRTLKEIVSAADELGVQHFDRLRLLDRELASPRS